FHDVWCGLSTNEKPESTRSASGNEEWAIHAAIVPVVAHAASWRLDNPIASDSGSVTSRFDTGTKPRSAGHHCGMSSGSQCNLPGSTMRYSLERRSEE